MELMHAVAMITISTVLHLTNVIANYPTSKLMENALFQLLKLVLLEIVQMACSGIATLTLVFVQMDQQTSIAIVFHAVLLPIPMDKLDQIKFHVNVNLDLFGMPPNPRVSQHDHSKIYFIIYFFLL